jgi:hypothetical protein
MDAREDMDPVVILGSSSVAVGPGQEHRLPVRVRNQGRRVESYRVDVVGPPAAFAEIVPPVVSVLPGREAELDVIFRPPGGTATPTGTLPFAVRATSEVDASSSAVAEGQLELAGVAGLQAWAPETTQSGRWSERFHIEFANGGNAAVRLALTAHDPTSVMRMQLNPDVVNLVPGGRTTVELKVKTRAPFLRGSTVIRSLQVSSQTYAFGAERPVPGGPPPQDDPNHRTFQLTFQQQPILPKFAIPLIVLAVVALIAFAVLKLRSDERPQLTLAAPVAPAVVRATSGGPDSILLAWRRVANAEGYRVAQTKVNGTEDQKVLEEMLPPDVDSTRVEELDPDTEYCFAVRAVGTNELMSTAKEACESTSGETELPAPTEVNADPSGGDRYMVTWNYDGPSEGVTFAIFVNGTPQGGPYPVSGVEIEIAADTEERQVEIAVQAQREDGEPSALSAGHELVISAEAPASTEAAPSTSVAGPPTTPAAEATTAPTTGDSTTSTAPTTSTSIPDAVSALQNLDSKTVAMLSPVFTAAEGGLPLDVQKAELADKYSVRVNRIRTFTNRDTVAFTPEGTPLLDFAEADAGRRFLYVARASRAAAQSVCDIDTTNTCRVLRLIGAANASEGTPIAVLDVASEAATPEGDALLDGQRDLLDTQAVHVVDGAAYEQFQTDRPVIYVRGFDSEEQATAFCTTNELPPEGCIVQVLSE